MHAARHASPFPPGFPPGSPPHPPPPLPLPSPRSIACTLQLLLFFFIAIFALHPHTYLEAHDPTALHFFKMPVLFLMLITVLNDGTLITVAYDNVNPSKQPEKWNLKALWAIAAVLSVVALVSSLLLLWAALDSWNPHGLFARFHLPGMKFDQIVTMMYLKGEGPPAAVYKLGCCL